MLISFEVAILSTIKQIIITDNTQMRVSEWSYTVEL